MSIPLCSNDIHHPGKPARRGAGDSQKQKYHLGRMPFYPMVPCVRRTVFRNWVHAAAGDPTILELSFAPFCGFYR